MEYKDLEIALHTEAEAVASKKENWTAEMVARRLNEIADLLTKIRKQHQSGVDASMGKRSGRAIEI